jgi:hypothetical protein
MGREPIGPRKRYPPLVVDADAVLTFTISMYCFKTIAGQSSQISQ